MECLSIAQEPFWGAQGLFCGAGVLSFAFLAFDESHKNNPSYMSGQAFTLRSISGPLSRQIPQMGRTVAAVAAWWPDDLCVSLWLWVCLGS